MPHPIYPVYNSPTVIKIPENVRCDFFGNNLLSVECSERDLPNRWVRFWMKVFFNTKFTFYKNKDNS